MRSGTVAVLCLVQFVDVLGVTSVVTAIPTIVHGLNAEPSAAGPVATTYAMFFGSMLVLGARLGDRFGHRRVLLVGIVAFGAVSVIGGTAMVLPQVLVARAVQGTAAAISAPSALRLLLHVSPQGAARTRALAAWSGVGAAAGAAGFLVGGLLTEALGWQSVFWVNAPIALVLVVGVLTLVPDEAALTHRSPLDVPGAVLLAASVMPLVLGTSLVGSADTRTSGLGLIAVGLAFGVCFVVRMRSAVAPLLPRAAFRSTNLRRGTTQAFVNTATTSSASVLATLVLQDRFHLSPLLSGFTLMGFSVAVVIGSTAARRIDSRVGADRLAAIGLGVIGMGDATLALGSAAWTAIAAGVCLAGFGIALASVAATGTGTLVRPALIGSATGVVNTGAQLGTAIGTAVVVLVATTVGPPAGWGLGAALALGTAAWCAFRTDTVPDVAMAGPRT